MKVGLVVMASGFSSRFGANKLLREIDGIPMIQRVLDAIPDSFRVVVVTRFAQVAEMASMRGYEVVENQLPHKSDTIRLGVDRLRDAVGICFMVGDQPWITPETLEKLRLAFLESPSHIVRAGNGGIPGNPVIFPSSLFDELASLSPGESGRAVIARHKDLVSLVEIDPTELSDVDFQGDINIGG